MSEAKLTKADLVDESKKMEVFEPDKMDWQMILDRKTKKEFGDKKMVSCKTDGIDINVSLYPAGYYKPMHVHSFGHGIYVIRGKLKTNNGTYPAGTFVWFPQGCVASHGATDDEPCEFLYITNHAGHLYYLDELEDGGEKA